MKESFFLLYINHSKYMFYLIIKQIEVKVFIHNFREGFGVTADLPKVRNRIDGVLKLIVHCICMFIVNEHANTMNIIK